MSIVPPPFLSLQALSGSFFFPPKYIPMYSDSRVVIGAQAQDAPGRPAQRAAPTNGVIAPVASSATGAAVLPITLDTRHLEAWISNNILYVRDLGTGFGTHVNGQRIDGPYALKRGDTITLGRRLARQANTPSYIADEQLKPVIFKVSFSGVANESL